MRASLRGREELATRVQQALALPTKKQAEMVVDAVVAALEGTLLNNLSTDGFTLKLGGFGKFSVRHKAGILRKIPFTGKTLLTKDRKIGGRSRSSVWAASVNASGQIEGDLAGRCGQVTS
jgi:nucleoid DNA-binding protein